MRKTRDANRKLRLRLEKAFEQRLPAINLDDEKDIYPLAWVLFVCGPEVDCDRLSMI